MTTSRALSLGLLVLGLGCATPRTQLRPAPAHTRLTNTPAEKMAAMPVPDPAADPENQDRRFGVESARIHADAARQKREEERRCLDVISGREAAKGKPPCLPPAK